MISNRSLLDLSLELAQAAAMLAPHDARLAQLYSDKAYDAAKKAFSPTAGVQAAELQAAEDSNLNDIPCDE